MPVDHFLNFLGMHLLAADLYDAVPTTNEVVAVAAQFHHVAGVNEPVCIDQDFAVAEIAGRYACRTDPQRTVLNAHLHLGAGMANQRAREACQAITYVESNSSLGRGKGMGHSGS